MKKLLLIALTCALLISAAACSSEDEKKKTNNKTDKDPEKIEVVTDDKGTPVTDEKGETMVKEPDVKETSTDTKNDETEPQGTVIAPNTSAGEEDPEEENVADGYITYEDEEGNTIVETHVEPEKQDIKEDNNWPSSVPSEVPAFTAYTAMDDPFYQDYGEYGLWTMGYFTTEADFDAYIAKLEKAGFVKSEDVFGIWGKGNITIDTWSEELDGEYWISLDVYKYNDPEVPDAFFAFETSHAVYSVEKRDGKIDISYECGSDFEGEAKAYLETLKANGFTVNGNTAVKKSGNTEYKCVIDVEDKTVSYSF